MGSPERITRASERHGRSGEALEHARAGTIMDPTSARLHRAAGLAAQAEGRLVDAWKMLSRARELGDHSAPLLEAIASLEMTRERMGAAAQILEESVRRHPQRAESWYLLGQCRGALGMPKAWLEAMHRATQAAPRAPRYWLGLVEAWLFNDRPDEALRAADRALSLDPDHFDGWLARARSLGMLAKNAAELAEADSAFQRAIHSTRAEAWEAAAARREYGKFLLAHGMASAAVEPLERSVRVVPEDQSAAYALAQAYRRVGAERRAEAALRRFEQVSGQLRDLRYLQSRVAADPFNPDVRLALARALEAADAWKRRVCTTSGPLVFAAGRMTA